jgi:hypothetical protein
MLLQRGFPLTHVNQHDGFWKSALHTATHEWTLGAADAAPLS